ncbi:hypothetical protein CcCBS67573_g06019, partial [Chytriomyces confervae]
RLACAEQQRREETKGLALRGEAAVLASRVAVLRHACTIAGITLVLIDIMPEFKPLSREARIAVKRGVKLFLQQEMGDRFRECMFTLEGAEHHTYGVPDEMLAGFRDWAVKELGRCFPDKLGLNEGLFR